MDIPKTSTEALATCFAPAERTDVAMLEGQRATFLRDDSAVVLMQAMPGYAMLINRQRQIVAVNDTVLRISGADSADQLIGRRPGEALNCRHADDTPGGCGTGEHCSVCGAVLAIVESQTTDHQAVTECRVTLGDAEETSLDMQATATPLRILGEKFTLFALQDISSEKRRNVLERVFFHDIVNTAGCIHGLASTLVEDVEIAPHLEKEYKNWLVHLSERLLDEIQGQRKLLAAEKGDFVPECALVSLRSLLAEVFQLYHQYDKTPGRILKVSDGPDFVVNTDASIVRRIIGNMVQNALEASPAGASVTISARYAEASVVIEVHNQGEIAQDVKLQLFKRSFSTKSAAGRGIGTYSMKLFGERYLNGKVAFRSTGDEGTVFSFTLPLQQ
jgi:K+-sensing histidine kinase KdpD